MRTYHLITGTIFSLVAAAHLLRIINHWSLVVGPWEVPVIISWIGFIIAAYLSIWSFWLMPRH